MADDGERGLAFALFGFSGAQFNLGVGALRQATLDALLTQQPHARLTDFDDGWGVRPDQVSLADRVVPITLCGARNSRRFYRSESYHHMRARAFFGGLGSAGLSYIDGADAVLDISGGDSFTDLYGARVFRTVVWPKRLALLRRRPLVLLPQTYGPFRNPRLRAQAADLVRRSALAWARDPDSFEAMRELLGTGFDPARHRQGVDVAFALAAHPPGEQHQEQLLRWWEADRGPVVGINASALLLSSRLRARFEVKTDAWQVILRLCERLLAESGVRIILVPHVYGDPGDEDDDVESLQRIQAALAPTYGDRLVLAPLGMDPHQTKWVISRTSWFVGTRMHATIAALSSGVPAANVAYSMKARGIFATVGQEESVADTRRLDGDELLDTLWRSWSKREQAAAVLAARLPAVVRSAEQQMAETVAVARAEAEATAPVRR